MTVDMAAATLLQDGVRRVGVAIDYRDLSGNRAAAEGAIYLPAQAAAGQAPLIFYAGYAADENSAVARAREGWAFATNLNAPDGQPFGGHPLNRGINLDAVLLHIARGLPEVDDSRVVIHGVSAGGRMALLLAAETFPLAGVIADVPPLNWPYNAAYLLNNGSWPADVLPSGPDAATVIRQGMTVLGDDLESASWYELSPIAHLDEITCPASLQFTTADVLVPVDQVGADLVRLPAAGAMPAGFTSDPDALTRRATSRRRCLVALGGEDAGVRILPVPEGAERLPQPDWRGTYARIEIGPSDHRWSFNVVDEGPPEPQVHHFKHALAFDHSRLLQEWRERPFDLRQLTRPKLEVLMSRYAGREWLVRGFTHLDAAERERADVLRALRTYVAEGGADRLRSVYETLDRNLQVLGPDPTELTAEP